MVRPFPFVALVLLSLAGPAGAASPALGEVNAKRAQKGLPPFAEDPALTAAALRAADYRAAHRIAGHVTGGMGSLLRRSRRRPAVSPPSALKARRVE